MKLLTGSNYGGFVQLELYYAYVVIFNRKTWGTCRPIRPTCCETQWVL